MLHLNINIFSVEYNVCFVALQTKATVTNLSALSLVKMCHKEHSFYLLGGTKSNILRCSDWSSCFNLHHVSSASHIDECCSWRPESAMPPHRTDRNNF